MVFSPINRWINNETFTPEISADVIDSNYVDKIKMQVYQSKITVKSTDLKQFHKLISQCLKGGNDADNNKLINSMPAIRRFLLL